MKLISIVALLAALPVLAALAQATNDVVSPTAPPEDRARHTALSRREFELNTRLKLLTELGQEHLARAEAARTARAEDLAKWEGDRSKELMSRAAKELNEMNAVVKQRTALEDAKRIIIPDPFEDATFKTNSVTPAEAAFLAKLQERTWELERDLNATLDAGQNYALQLQTNSSPDEIGRVSLELEANGRQLRILQRELFELELKRLQFRALRPPR